MVGILAHSDRVWRFARWAAAARVPIVGARALRRARHQPGGFLWCRSCSAPCADPNQWLT